MNEPENFLTRWSRRKRVAEEPDPPAPAAEAVPESKDSAPDGETKRQPAPIEADPVFDPASLPSLESIGAQTDISPFLKPGVPGDLRNAALRRAWATDPAIRDFKGLQENDWDFNDPTAMHGFGALDPGTDVKKMLAQMFGEAPVAGKPDAADPALVGQPTPPSHELASPAEQQVTASATEPAHDSEIMEPERVAAIEPDAVVQRKENIASQEDAMEPGDTPLKRRRPQGGALPH